MSDDMRNDETERFDAWLQGVARSYDAPPALDKRAKDDMWAVIAAAGVQGRDEGSENRFRPAAIAARGGAVPQLRSAPRIWWSAAAAAVLVIAGIGIGRTWRSAEDAPQPVQVAARDTSRGTAIAMAGDSTRAPAAVDVDGGTKGDTNSGTNRRSTAGSSGELGAAGASVVAAVEEPSPRRPVVAPAADPAAETRVEGEGVGTRIAAGRGARRIGNRPGLPGMGQVASSLALVRHLAQAEALLVSFEDGAPAEDAEARARMDTRIARWAKDLLTNTRILLDSPAANDPLRRQLLEDLELVLAQMAALAPATGAAGTDSARDGAGEAGRDRGMIEGTLKNGQVLPRLRTAIPAGASGA